MRGGGERKERKMEAVRREGEKEAERRNEGGGRGKGQRKERRNKQPTRK